MKEIKTKIEIGLVCHIPVYSLFLRNWALIATNISKITFIIQGQLSGLSNESSYQQFSLFNSDTKEDRAYKRLIFALFPNFTQGKHKRPHHLYLLVKIQDKRLNSSVYRFEVNNKNEICPSILVYKNDQLKLIWKMESLLTNERNKNEERNRAGLSHTRLFPFLKKLSLNSHGHQ